SVHSLVEWNLPLPCPLNATASSSETGEGLLYVSRVWIVSPRHSPATAKLRWVVQTSLTGGPTTAVALNVTVAGLPGSTPSFHETTNVLAPGEVPSVKTVEAVPSAPVVISAAETWPPPWSTMNFSSCPSTGLLNSSSSLTFGWIATAV